MFYPEDFKKRVKEIYPERKDLHRMLEYGLLIVGQILDDAAPKGMNFEEVLNATSLEELQESARLQKAKYDLYLEWCELNNANKYKILKT